MPTLNKKLLPCAIAKPVVFLIPLVTLEINQGAEIKRLQKLEQDISTESDKIETIYQRFLAAAG